MGAFKLGGWKKDPHDERDYKFEAMTDALKLRVSNFSGTHLIPERTPLSDQGNLSSCVGNSSTDALEILLGVQDPTSVVQLSRLMTYWIARSKDGSQNEDSGAYIRNAFLQLSKLGVCPETVWPYKEDKVFTSPPLEAYEIGNSNKVSGAYRITSTGQQRLDDIELAVRADHPVVFGTTVGDDFTNWEKGNAALPPETHEGGGHAIICTGVRRNVRKREFWIRNSWGPDWADNGHIWLTEEYMMWSATTDLWVATLMPKLVL